MGLQQPPEDATQEEEVGRKNGVGPLALRPGDKVRLKKLRSDSTMNGLTGSFVKLDENAVDGEDRYHIELDADKGPVSVRVSNITKIPPPKEKRAPGAVAAKAQPAPKEGQATAKAQPAPKKQPTPKASAPRKSIIKAKARPKPKATAAAAQKQVSSQRKSPAPQPTKTRRGPGRKGEEPEENRFDEQEHRICAHPCVEVFADGWTPVHIFESRLDGRIVLAYGNGEFEGLPPSKPYRLEGVPKDASGVLFWTGKGGRLLDSDGELIQTRQRPRTD